LVSAVLALAVLVLAGPEPARAEDPRPPAVLRLLHVNDVYEVSPNKAGLGGLAELATMVNAAEAEPGADLTLVTFGGDLISPSLLSSIDKGRHMITAMDMVGVDLAVPGNHEFDFGPEVFAEHLKTSPFPWLGTNVLDENEQPFGGMVATALRNVGPYKVGFLGVLTDETTTLSDPGEHVLFLDPIAKAKDAAVNLKVAGADVVIALTHLLFEQDKALAQEVPDIDLILGGHDHEAITWMEGETLILKAGMDAEYLAEINLTIKEVKGRKALEVTTLPAWSLTPVTGVAPNPQLAAKVAEWDSMLDKELGEPLAVTKGALDSRKSVVRSQESTMGDLIADALRVEAKADIGFTNGGGIRGDRLYDPDTTLTRKDLVTEMPFGNVSMVVELTGAQLKETLEHGLSQVGENGGRFLQVSGMTLTYAPNQPVGDRVVSVTVGDAPLDEAASYTVATNDYIAEGGDGFKALGEGKVLVDASAGQLMVSVVADYLTALKEVTVTSGGRVLVAK
jgi:5'-nucleotidase